MLNLAIECSGGGGSIALLREQEVVAERPLSAAVGSLQSLAKSLDEMLVAHGNRQVELISVSVGPGSFTGLRVGLTTAKMLGFAWGTPLAPVDTLHAICWGTACHQPCQADGSAQPAPTALVAVLNAFRQQVFAAAWLLEPSPSELPSLRPLAPTQVLDAARWQSEPLQSLTYSQLAPPVSYLVSGPGLRIYRPTLSIALADEACWEPTAGVIGGLGWLAHLAGASVAARELQPNYVRGSAAEEAAARRV